MYLGRIVELGKTEQVFRQPTHPYTRALLSSVALPDPDVPVSGETLEGEIPSPMDLPSGCHLYSRCAYRLPECREAYPPPQEVEPGHWAACFRADEIFQRQPAADAPSDRKLTISRHETS
jgi:oligopeptide/dipeptide ABC transporter ATP-binding protein